MKTSVLLFCVAMLAPVMLLAQETPAPAPAEVVAPAEVKAPRKAPTPEQREAFRKRMAERRQKMKEARKAPLCPNADCPCAKAMAELRPTPPEKKFDEMTEEERAAFRETMKAKMEEARQKMEEARKACTCEDCFCKKAPRRPMGPRGPRGPRSQRRGKAPAAPAPAPAA